MTEKRVGSPCDQSYEKVRKVVPAYSKPCDGHGPVHHCRDYPYCSHVCTLSAAESLWCVSHDFVRVIQERQRKVAAFAVLGIFIGLILLTMVVYTVIQGQLL